MAASGAERGSAYHQLADVVGPPIMAQAYGVGGEELWRPIVSRRGTSYRTSKDSSPHSRRVFAMALEAKGGSSGLEKVRIPGGIHRCLDNFLGDLKLRILEAACRKARVRAVDPEATVVSVDDVLNCVRVAFAEASSELEKALRQHETRNVRNAS
jgi:hypothetical protein